MSGNKKTSELDSWATLRQAAAQIEEEDQLEGSMGLLEAADEVAAILNLPSPLRNKRGDTNLTATQDSLLERTSHSLSLSESRIHANLINVDADHLLKDMKLEPKEIPNNRLPAQTVAFEDIDALMKIAKGNEYPEENPDSEVIGPSERSTFLRTQISRNSSDRVRAHYLQRLQSTRQSHLSQSSGHLSGGISRGAMSLTSQMSKLSRKLQQLSPGRMDRLCQSDIQQRLLSSMHVLNHSSSSQSKSTTKSRKDDEKYHDARARDRTNSLAQPRSTLKTAFGDRDHQFLLFDEAKECHFIPNYAKRMKEKRKKDRESRHDSDEEEDRKRSQDPFFAFLSRQEGEERKRREEVKYLQKKLDYDAQQSKKQCPSCGSLQSYDEVREKRKVCPACNIAYTSPLSWSTVARQFLRRTRDYQKSRDINLKQLAKEIIQRERGENSAGSPHHHRDKIVCDVEEFLHRLSEAADRRNARLQRVEEELYKESTFQPRLRGVTDDSKSGNRKNDRDGEEEELMSVLSSDPVRDFLLRYEEDLEDRKRRMPQRFRTKANADRPTLADDGDNARDFQSAETQRFRF